MFPPVNQRTVQSPEVQYSCSLSLSVPDVGILLKAAMQSELVAWSQLPHLRTLSATAVAERMEKIARSFILRRGSFV